MNAHIGLHVTNLKKSIDFYTDLFGENPVKVKENYAKFMPENLALIFTLNLVNEVHGNQVGHFGIQVKSGEVLLKHKERLVKAGSQITEEMNTNCCYALQDKFWINDPDGNEWEFFYTKNKDSQEDLDDVGGCYVSQ
ncbi:ArsI/CadI family heavy metal resistance metalloenzyme [Bacillus sp. FJAT-44742]|uniref:ArsI/CadI family heavy metal resistance metalloenzyme n=1 Tax=Bacillus sp. FJAT-44742 TaxID=2014005 RepID=UPI000C2480FF